MNKYVKDGKVISATEKAYGLIYKEQGYIPYKEAVKNSKKKEEADNS